MGWVQVGGGEMGEERKRGGEREGMGEGRHTTSFNTTRRGRAMRKNLWLSLVSSK